MSARQTREKTRTPRDLKPHEHDKHDIVGVRSSSGRRPNCGSGGDPLCGALRSLNVRSDRRRLFLSMVLGQRRHLPYRIKPLGFRPLLPSSHTHHSRRRQYEDQLGGSRHNHFKLRPRRASTPRNLPRCTPRPCHRTQLAVADGIDGGGDAIPRRSGKRRAPSVQGRETFRSRAAHRSRLARAPHRRSGALEFRGGERSNGARADHREAAHCCRQTCGDGSPAQGGDAGHVAERVVVGCDVG